MQACQRLFQRRILRHLGVARTCLGEPGSMGPAEQTEPRVKRARFAEEEQEPDPFGEEDDR